jgi:predicted RNA-binding Zn ribbon-like protein
VQPVTGYNGVVVADGGTSDDIALLVAFANTLDQRSFTRHRTAHRGGDKLAAAASAQRWLTGHGLLAPGARLTAAELADLLAFRDGLRQALAAKAAAPGNAAAIEQANAVLTRAPLVLQIGDGGLPRLGPQADGAPGAVARLAAMTAAMAARGSWHRLRMCAAPDCRWVFYDTSRRGGARWCSMAVCGNRVKTRRYRSRRAAAG